MTDNTSDRPKEETCRLKQMAMQSLHAEVQAKRGRTQCFWPLAHVLSDGAFCLVSTPHLFKTVLQVYHNGLIDKACVKLLQTSKWLTYYGSMVDLFHTSELSSAELSSVKLKLSVWTRFFLSICQSCSSNWMSVRPTAVLISSRKTQVWFTECWA